MKSEIIEIKWSWDQPTIQDILLKYYRDWLFVTPEIANKMVAVLKYPPLQETLANHGNFEVRKLRWKDAAAKCVRIYEETLVAV